MLGRTITDHMRAPPRLTQFRIIVLLRGVELDTRNAHLRR